MNSVYADRQVIRGSTAAMRDAVHLDQAEWHADSAGKKEQNVQFAAFLSPLSAHMPPCSRLPRAGNGPGFRDLSR